VPTCKRCAVCVQVLKTQHTQQGRGGATIQVELRDLASGLKSSERLRTSESIERVFVEDKTYTFLYAEGDSIILMEPKSFEQVTLLRNLLGTGAAYLAGMCLCTILVTCYCIDS
jgi:translation elongation factor P/translation initiation factor 5A